MGQELQAARRFVIDVEMPLEVRGPDELAVPHTMAVDRLLDGLRAPGQVRPPEPVRQRGERAPHQRVVIGQIGVDDLVVGGLQEGLVEFDFGVALGFQHRQDAKKAAFHARFLKQRPLARAREVALQRDHRRTQLVQLKARLQKRAVDIAAVLAHVADLPGEHVHENLPRVVRVREHNRRKAPQQAVAVPVGRRNIIARAARGHQAQFLRIQRAAAGKEERKEQVFVHHLRNRPVLRRKHAFLKPSQRLAKAAPVTQAQKVLGRGCRRHRLHADPEDQLRAHALSRREQGPAAALKGHISPLPFYPRFRDGRKGAQRQARHLLHHESIVPAAGLLRAPPVQHEGFVHLVQRARPLPPHAQPDLQRRVAAVFRLQAHKEGPLAQRAQIRQRHAHALRLSLRHGHPGVLSPPAKRRGPLRSVDAPHGRDERPVSAA